MTWLAWFNFVVLQWACIRLARIEEESGEQVAWALIGPVLPLTGWGSGYVGRPIPFVSWACAPSNGGQS